MPKQNRVNPFGEIVTISARGTLMGNRGCLHDANGRIRTQSGRPAWVTCLLKYKGRKREVMSPGQYTELFFLDEATALGAGHRPCGTCQKARYDIFKTLWMQANTGMASNIQDLDRHLNGERLASVGTAAFWLAKLGDLPSGVFVVTDTDPKSALLIWEGRLYPWTANGYLAPRMIDMDEHVLVLTPRSICRTLDAGFWPKVHPSIEMLLSMSNLDTVPSRDESPGRTNAWEPQTFAPQPVQEVREPVPEASMSEQTLHRLSTTPRGRALYTYFAAILEVTGMNSGGVFPLKKFLGNFSGHEKAGRIEKVDGGYRLTPDGIDYSD